MRGTTAFKVLQDLVAPSLCSGCYSSTLNAVKPCATYLNLYVEINNMGVTGQF